MATLPESLGFVDGIYQLETTDPVEGGPEGIANQQGKQLASRTKWLKDNRYAQYQVIELDCPQSYLTANFDSNGLGLSNGLWPGFAICNGLNGTKNRGGRVGVAYGTGYTVMGDIGGNKDAIVPQHNHGLATQILKRQPGAGNVLNFGNDYPVQELGTGGAAVTNNAGESAVNKNMQPYIVSLFIQKL